MPVPTVYAYRDAGPMTVATKWKPRRVECTGAPDHSDAPGIMFVVKYASGKEGCACAISELICTQLLGKVGLRTLDPHLVSVSPSFAASCNLKMDLRYAVSPGYHYGTTLKTDVDDGPPLSLGDLFEPNDLVLLWVADTWIGNIDRPVYGNTLLELAGSSSFHLIASDQSDCFGGTGLMCSEGFESGFLKLKKAPGPEVLTAAIFQSGGSLALCGAIAKVQQAAAELDDVISVVPATWWFGSGLGPSLVKKVLLQRLEHLIEILNPGEWEVIDGVVI
jgi:hypothetical protein